MKKATHFSFETSTCSTPRHTVRGIALTFSAFEDKVREAIAFVQRNSRRGEMAYAAIRFYDDEPSLQYEIEISSIFSGSRYPNTGYAIPEDSDAVDVRSHIYDDGADYYGYIGYLYSVCGMVPPGSGLYGPNGRREVLD